MISEPQSRAQSVVSRKLHSAWNADLEKSSAEQKDANELLLEENPPTGCWYWFTTCIGGLWATQTINKKNDRETFVRTTIRELVVYCMFLLVLCALTFGMTSSTMFYYTKVMMNLFSGATGVTQVNQYWDFLENDMLNGLYWEYYYNDGTDKAYVCPGGEEITGPCPLAPADRNILYENRLLGLPRMRQLRVKNDSCTVHQDFQNAIKQCFNAYSSSIEDPEPFGNTAHIRTSPDAWSYQTEAQTTLSSHGAVLHTYSGAGSIQDLHSLKNESLEIIKELKEGLWIGRGTRFASIDFTVYNANINLFCIVKITFEFPPTGGVMPQSTFRTVKLLRYVTPTDFFIMACEVIFVIFIIYYMVEEAMEMKNLKWDYFYSVWNILDLIVIAISLISIAMNLYTYFVVQSKLKDLLAEPDQFADFASLGSLSKTNNNVTAINVFFAWIKLFKYISFNKTMTQLSSTLSRCAKDVAGFSVMFFTVFFAFAQLGFLLFGTQVEDFHTFSNAIFTLLRTILGDFDFHAIESANRVLGPIFFLSYVFFVFFVLLNMFLAIINDTYSEVKEEIAVQSNDFEISDYFKRGYNNVLGQLGAKNVNFDIENALKIDPEDSNNLTYDEVRQNLKKCNFSDMEIEMFFARYDHDGRFMFDPDNPKPDPAQLAAEEGSDVDGDGNDRPSSGRQARSARARSARAGSATSRPGTAVGNIGGEEFSLLGRRVDRMEHSIGSIVSKIDAVLIKLESMEKNKHRRKATMSKILGTITEDDTMDEATKRKQMEELVRKELETWDESRPGTTESDMRPQR